MKINEAKVFVFIAAIIVGVLISLNINLNEVEERVFFTSKQYQDAYSERNKLYKEISDYKEIYYENYSKLQDYQQGKKNKDEKIISDVVNELEKNKAILGYSQVKGEGLSLTITDGTGNFSNDIDDPLLRWMRTFHNTDMIQVINELKNAGAEGISVNGQRLMTNSEVYCSWAFISINQVKLPAPFYIDVIGNKENLRGYINSNESYLKILINRGINVQITEKDEVTIPTYTGDIKVNYIKASNYK